MRIGTLRAVRLVAELVWRWARNSGGDDQTVGSDDNGFGAGAVIEAAAPRFSGPVIEDKALSLAFFTDPDGNPLYIAEMKPVHT